MSIFTHAEAAIAASKKCPTCPHLEATVADLQAWVEDLRQFRDPAERAAADAALTLSKEISLLRMTFLSACARVALVLMAVCASFGLAGCGSIDDLKDAVSRWFDIGKTPGGRAVFADNLPDALPMIPPEKPSRKEASKASKKKDKPASKVQRPQTAEKKLPTSDTTEAPKPQGAEPQSAPSQPTPSRLRTLWPEAPPAGIFSR